LAALNVALAGTAIGCVYLSPMYLVGRWHRAATCTALLAGGAIVVLYFTWYRTLPAADEDEPGKDEAHLC
jgi:hypothetical protein